MNITANEYHKERTLSFWLSVCVILTLRFFPQFILFAVIPLFLSPCKSYLVCLCFSISLNRTKVLRNLMEFSAFKLLSLSLSWCNNKIRKSGVLTVVHEIPSGVLLLYRVHFHSVYKRHFSKTQYILGNTRKTRISTAK